MTHTSFFSTFIPSSLPINPPRGPVVTLLLSHRCTCSLPLFPTRSTAPPRPPSSSQAAGAPSPDSSPSPSSALPGRHQPCHRMLSPTASICAAPYLCSVGSGAVRRPPAQRCRGARWPPFPKSTTLVENRAALASLHCLHSKPPLGPSTPSLSSAPLTSLDPRPPWPPGRLLPPSPVGGVPHRRTRASLRRG